MSLCFLRNSTPFVLAAFLVSIFVLFSACLCIFVVFRLLYLSSVWELDVDIVF